MMRGDIRGHHKITTPWQQLMAGAVAEVDPDQMAISRQLTPSQRFQQGYLMTRLAQQTVAYRQRLRQTPPNQPLLREKEINLMDNFSMDFGAFMHLVLEALEAVGVDYLIGGARRFTILDLRFLFNQS